MASMRSPPRARTPARRRRTSRRCATRPASPSATRLFLGLMVIRMRSEVLGREVGHRLVYDAPHNLIWKPEGGRGPLPPSQWGDAGARAGSLESLFRFTGRRRSSRDRWATRATCSRAPAQRDLLASACRGAGRASPVVRRAMSTTPSTRGPVPDRLRVVTPIDSRLPEVRARARSSRSITVA